MLQIILADYSIQKNTDTCFEMFGNRYMKETGTTSYNFIFVVINHNPIISTKNKETLIAGYLLK